MTLYIGVDLHARQQTVAYCDEETGEVNSVTLHHERDDVQGFYQQFAGREVIVGVEAIGFTLWFERLMLQLGYSLWLGHARIIRQWARRRQKTDDRDAVLILELLLRGEFPRVHRPSPESLEVMRLLRMRHKMIKIRTMLRNMLQATAIGQGVAVRRRLFSQSGQELLTAVALTPAQEEQRQWITDQLATLAPRIHHLDHELAQRAAADQDVQLLQTHPGIGPLTALAVVHKLRPVRRFANGRKVVAYVGLDPVEWSSADKTRRRGISKEGSALIRFFLGQAAWAAIKHDAELRRFYFRLNHRKGAPKAITAVARKLVIRCFIMLRDGVDYPTFLRRGQAAQPACSGSAVDPVSGA
jgi:transposase